MRLINRPPGVAVKKIISVITILFLAHQVAYYAFLLPQTKTSPENILPAHLKIIDAEAFSGTALDEIVLPTGLVEIGGEAFAGSDTLKSIFIPETVSSIDDTAFQNTGLRAIYGKKGSHADQWAGDHGIPFSCCDILFFLNRNHVHPNAFASVLQCFWIAPAAGYGITHLLFIFRHFRRSMRPQDRAELYTLSYWFP